MLPGLWQIMFSLGVFASCRSLPRGDVRGRHLVSRRRSRDARAGERRAPFSPWAMAMPFGIGQFLMAFVLYRATGGDDGEELRASRRRFAYEGLDRVIHEKARLSAC